MSKKLSPIAQEYFDDNRERFEAETTIANMNLETHQHSFYRKSATEIGCKNCSNGWIDPTGELIKLIK